MTRWQEPNASAPSQDAHKPQPNATAPNTNANTHAHEAVENKEATITPTANYAGDGKKESTAEQHHAHAADNSYIPAHRGI